MMLLAACSQQKTPVTEADTEITSQASSWQPLGSALDYILAKDASEPSLTLDVSGNPVVAWTEVNVNSRVLVKRWTGTAWSLLTPTDFYFLPHQQSTGGSYTTLPAC